MVAELTGLESWLRLGVESVSRCLDDAKVVAVIVVLPIALWAVAVVDAVRCCGLRQYRFGP